MDETTQTRLRELLLATVPEDGSTIGNVSLLREVQRALEAEGRKYDEDAGSGPHSLDSAAADVRWNLRANVMLPKTETESQHRTRSA